MRCLLRQARYAIDAGVDVIQIRERDLDAATLVALTSAVVAMARGTQTRIVVNDRIDVALAAGADGVHLRADSVSPEAVRTIAPSGFLVGRSVHSASEAAMVSGGVDYVIAGTVWTTRSKPGGHASLNPSGLAQVVGVVDVPVLAIGGVTPERLPAVRAAGAAGVAAIGLFMKDAEMSGTPSCGAIPLETIVKDARLKFDTSR